MDIRFVLPSEVEQLVWNVMTSFSPKTPAALFRDMEDGLHHPDEGRYLGCFDDDEILLGSILMMDFTPNVRGVMMPTGAAAYVSANFLHRKERVAHTLLKVLMWYYAKQGTPIGCLHPFNPAFYANMGYGYCNENYLYQPKPSAIRSYGGKFGLFHIRSEDRQKTSDFHRAYAARAHGATVHHYMNPHRISDMPYVVACRRDGRLTGYFTFDFMAVDHYTDTYHDLFVPEMVYEDLDTLRQLITFFVSQVDQIERVCILSSDLSLTILFHSPGTGENRAHDDCIREVACRTMGYMARIFDVPAYFRMQSHCESPVSRPLALALQVDDNFIKGNDGTFLLNTSRSTVEVVERAQLDVTLSADTFTPSSPMMGTFSLDEALRLDHLILSDHGYAADAQRAIGWSRKPANFTYF